MFILGQLSKQIMEKLKDRWVLKDIDGRIIARFRFKQTALQSRTKYKMGRKEQLSIEAIEDEE